ncbi:RNA polymerase sigma factor [Solirubrobacter ginsenosidimutans]|uniref:RNA polymerase sigma factor n=1 Tax=Solirubrobacter ginsenosidimutans TaxID=490573 RepID=A0A9X3MUE3_9ACTN|nr:RNA polymerase sigma factor [Solirubrobacter ginsenosidimutans]MDA0162700.1 RNA polymerase sigma factor [Solirubrobacter ginsenosidimutans]
MEASAIHAPAALHRFPLGGGLLRLRSDEQLVAAFRGGNDEAFRVLHDRYRQRLFAYVRQMLSAGSRQDAEDVLQDVFVRAYGALRNDNREMNVRAWLYRVAHNRCIDHLRRPVPPAAEIFEVSRKPLHDPVEEAQRRDDLRQLVADVGQLPEQQRSALLMREMDGMTYADLANALDVTVPAVKSLLVRARVGLVEAAEARDADCAEIQADLLRAYDKGVKASGRARKHMRTCDSCASYRGALRGMRRSFAALTPVGVGPLAFAAKLIGLGGSAAGGAGAAAGGGGAGAAVAGGGLATATACKVAAVVCTAAIATGGAVEVNHQIAEKAPVAPAHATKTVHSRPAQSAPAPISAPVRTAPQPSTLTPAHATAAAAPAAAAKRKAKPATETRALKEKKVTTVPVALERPDTPVATAVGDTQDASGGVRAPDASVTPTPVATTTPTAPVAPIANTPQATPAPATTSEQPATPPAGGGVEAPAPVDAPPPAGG